MRWTQNIQIKQQAHLYLISGVFTWFVQSLIHRRAVRLHTARLNAYTLDPYWKLLQHNVLRKSLLWGHTNVTAGTILFIKCTMELCCLQNVQWLVQMDNVLIDDRRIHVDFSQSVSRLWNRYRKFGTKSSGEGQWLEWLNLMHLICILQWKSRSYSKYKRPTDTLEARSMTIYFHSYIDANNIIWYHWP